MTDHDPGPGPGPADHTGKDLRDSVDRGAQKVKAEARSAAETARSRATEEAAARKEDGARHIDAFAQAVRKAADELGTQDESVAAQFVREAAGGLETLSGTIRQKSVGEMVDSVSRFGRTNPTAFLGGALLAGIALGRFARASSERAHPADTHGNGHAAAAPSRPAGSPVPGPTPPMHRAGDTAHQDTAAPKPAPVPSSRAPMPMPQEADHGTR